MVPHLRTAPSVERLLGWFLIASLPVALVGIWNLGGQILGAYTADAIRGSDWRMALLQMLAESGPDVGFGSALIAGLSCFLPLLMVSLAVSAFLARIFARQRNRDMDPGWIMNGWLFTLLLPGGVTLGVAGLAMSFGVVVGSLIFGGTGRYLVSPALLGALFVHFSYPDLAQTALPLAAADVTMSWLSISEQGIADRSILAHFLGVETGAMGTTSVLACLAGGLLLMRVGVASWRILAGGILGLVLTAVLVDAALPENAVGIGFLPWYWQPMLGNFAFALMFLATDPSSGPLTRPARWLYGGIFGVLTIAIRTLDPSHPEGTLFALMLATLAIPLFDYLVVRRYWSEPGGS